MSCELNCRDSFGAKVSVMVPGERCPASSMPQTCTLPLRFSRLIKRTKPCCCLLDAGGTIHNTCSPGSGSDRSATVDRLVSLPKGSASRLCTVTRPVADKIGRASCRERVGQYV